jgi:hypothetical protein
MGERGELSHFGRENVTVLSSPWRSAVVSIKPMITVHQLYSTVYLLIMLGHVKINKICT